MRRLLLLVMALIVVTVLPASACSQGPIDLSGIEVREYQGENLSSINDFRENAIEGRQYIDQNSYELAVNGLVETPLTLSYDEVTSGYDLYKKVVTLNCITGWSATILWEGMLITDLIARAGVADEAKVIIFHAEDGYTTSLAIEYITDNDIIMAYKVNDVVLPPERGFPFQLVAESKWGYKWIKWITRIELSDNIDYKGYWEERGASNNGDLDGSKFEN
jgi:DMSO/TMAO reductase YedYZ molybdopterin-dependent catalytic subunit